MLNTRVLAAPVVTCMFTQVRPPDYALPYKTLEDNSVVFSAPVKRGNTLVTIMVGPLPSGAEAVDCLFILFILFTSAR
jgi:hypothetical protein